MADKAESKKGAETEVEEPKTAGEEKPAAEEKRDPERTFTQSELDAILRDRLERERKKFESFDELQAKAKKLDDLEEAQKSEQQKLQDRVDKAEAEAETARQQAKQTLLRAAIVSKAASLDFADPSDAYVLLDKSSLEVGDDGEVEGLEDALKSLADAKPYMLKQDDQSKARPRRQTPTLPGDNATSASESEDERAQRLGLA